VRWRKAGGGKTLRLIVLAAEFGFTGIGVQQKGSGRFIHLDDLGPGEVVVRVQYSDINYKDALAATGAGRILRKYPLVGGIDLAGVVAGSSDPRYTAGQPVLVTGCGPIGSLLIGGLRRAGAARIVAVDLSDLALDCARRMGADETHNLRTQPNALEPYKKDKGQFDAVFEASGSEQALRTGMDVIAPRGTLVTVGLGGDISLPMNQIVAKEIELRGSFRFHPEFATAVQFLNQGLIDGKPVITRILPLADAQAAFELAADKRQSLKVQIAFGDAATALESA
jgi:threonine dehydrogenase-like Zn-dependent dehydrogenase